MKWVKYGNFWHTKIKCKFYSVFEWYMKTFPIFISSFPAFRDSRVTNKNFSLPQKSNSRAKRRTTSLENSKIDIHRKTRVDASMKRIKLLDFLSHLGSSREHPILQEKCRVLLSLLRNFFWKFYIFIFVLVNLKLETLDCHSQTSYNCPLRAPSAHIPSAWLTVKFHNFIELPTKQCGELIWRKVNLREINIQIR